MSKAGKEMHQCAALEWQKTVEGMDYVPCTKSYEGKQARLCRLEGLLLAVEVYLCGAHENYFRSCPKGWGSTKVTVVK